MKINLQLFAEGGPAAPNQAPAAEPTATTATEIESAQTETSTSTASVSTSQRLKDLWDKANSAQPTTDTVDTPAQQAPTQEPPANEPQKQEPPVQDNPAGQQAQPEKILNKYESVGDLVKAYQSLQTTYTRDHLALLETQKALEQLKAEKAELEAKLHAPNPQPEPTNVLTDDLANLDAETLLEKFYEDPRGVLAKIAESVVEGKVKPLESKIAPVIEQTEAQKNLENWNNAVMEFNNSNPDMKDYIDGMKQYIIENNLQDSKEPQKVLRDAYAHAKAQAADIKLAEATARIEELEGLLRTSKEDAIREHLATVRNSQNMIPNTIAGNSNSGAPAIPPLDLKGKPMREVHKAAAAFIFGDRN